jgi:prepilin-type N-terminal cleavage/methylation domain-containing protein
MVRERGASKGRRRSGFTLLEIAVSAAMLAVLLLVVGKTIVAVEVSARRADEHAESLRVVDNLLEQLLAAPWDAIDAGAIGRLTLPEYVQTRWPAARVSGSVQNVDEPVPAKRVSLTLSPRGADGRSMTMTTWIYQAPGN